MESKSAWPAVLAVITVIALIATCFVLYSVASDKKTIPSADEIAAKVVVNTTAVQPYNDTDIKSDIAKIKQEVLKEDTKESKALALATSELNSRDFKKALQEFLNSEYNATRVEDYKDIVSSSVKDSDVDVSGDSADVDFELKVGYFLDGDDDESDKEYARVSLALSVSGLDEDEDFVDAEVDSYDESDFTLIKFYD